VLAVLPLWWERRAHACGLTGRWQDLAFALDAPLLALPEQVRPDESLLDAAAEELGQAYVSALSPGVQSRHGRHYTPPPLANHLWQMVRSALRMTRGQLRPLPGLVSDPACGAGALLLPPLREHLHAVARSDPRLALAALANLIEGTDADPSAVAIANVVLTAEALPILAAVPAARRRPLTSLATVADGLASAARPARAVVMNPPYGRVRLAADERERFAHVLYGHANLYSLFMAAGLERLDRTGVLGALVPTSFTAGRYFSNLRAELSRVAPLSEAAFVADRGGVFAGVLQETCLATFSKRRARQTAVSSLDGEPSSVARVASPRTSRPWLLPRRADDAIVAAGAASLRLTLRDCGWRASTGPLVWNRRKDDLFPEPAPGRFPVIWAADVDGGSLHQDPQRDSLRFIALEADKRPTYCLQSPAVLVQRTTAPEQGRRVVSVELSRALLAEWGGRVVVENHVNVLRPASGRPPAISLGTLNAVLATQTIDRVMRCVSGSVAVSAYELEALPLPDEGTLASWEVLRGEALERAVANAYRPKPT